MSNAQPVFAILGAGRGGKAMAADLAVRGFQARQFNRTFGRVESIKMWGGTELGTEEGD